MGDCIGIDIGGTKIAAGVVDDEGTLVASARRPTPGSDVGAIVSAAADLVQELQQSYAVTGIGVGAAGFVDAARATILFAPNL